MALADMSSWITQAESAVAGLMGEFEFRFGYAPGVNEVRRAGERPLVDVMRLPDQAEAFFGVVDAVSWQEVWNGYFLGPAVEVVRRSREHDPGSLRTSGGLHDVLVVGSDGGGAYFAIDLESGEVVQVADAVVNDGVRGRSRVVAADFDGFLDELIENVRKVTCGRDPEF